MKLPRDLSGVELPRAREQLVYPVPRQTGSHLRLTADVPSRHHITIPVHDPLKVGTLAAGLADVAAHSKLGRDELLRRLFG